ncbi:hypothetical protein MAPG_11542 [Magnaporthiopsis poae ATCC 64411]|uniref:Protein kinase domain-containing protein n=1 Tax=Magnaporthiopsis poae (strain ATCC 64411 / 73-15) TaxID=644358 RepID=A0A0C4EFJ2_MAGP6|nr:hypothetical protein MAPG_11542 [Magnaporthiopsis poae ATCC 64411]
MANTTETTGGPGDAPPIDEDFLQGPPPMARRDFRHARLRQFPGSSSKINWLEYLGQGIQGVVYKATIDDGDPVAVKIFWRTHRPDPAKQPSHLRGPEYFEWPFKDECRAVALMEKIKWAMRRVETDPERTILVKEGPQTVEDAINNLYAFSDAGRHGTARQDGTLTPPPPFPALPECYGWMRVKRDTLSELGPPVWEQVNEDVDWHWAIVYEFVPPTPQDLGVGQAHLDFFYALGFALDPYKPDNWHGGRLVDYNDICPPFTRGWSRHSVCRCEAEEWFWTRECGLYRIDRGVQTRRLV